MVQSWANGDAEYSWASDYLTSAIIVCWDRLAKQLMEAAAGSLGQNGKDWMFLNYTYKRFEGPTHWTLDSLWEAVIGASQGNALICTLILNGIFDFFDIFIVCFKCFIADYICSDNIQYVYDFMHVWVSMFSQEL